MSSITEDWRNLKPLIGQFAGKLNELTQKGADFEAAIAKTEYTAFNKGYSKALEDCRDKDCCAACKSKAFYDSMKKYETFIDKYNKLSSDDKFLIDDFIERLGKKK